jgi:hypothetical protein
MKTKIASIVCFGCLALIGVADNVHAQGARAPIGVWHGKVNDGGTLTVVVNGSGMMYRAGNSRPTTGAWTWNPTYSGGIITLHYINGGMQTRAYYSITYLARNRILLSDPYFKAVLVRQ